MELKGVYSKVAEITVVGPSDVFTIRSGKATGYLLRFPGDTSTYVTHSLFSNALFVRKPRGIHGKLDYSKKASYLRSVSELSNNQTVMVLKNTHVISLANVRPMLQDIGYPDDIVEGVTDWLNLQAVEAALKQKRKAEELLNKEIIHEKMLNKEIINDEIINKESIEELSNGEIIKEVNNGEISDGEIMINEENINSEMVEEYKSKDKEEMIYTPSPQPPKKRNHNSSDSDVDQQNIPKCQHCHESFDKLINEIRKTNEKLELAFNGRHQKMEELIDQKIEEFEKQFEKEKRRKIAGFKKSLRTDIQEI